MTTMTLTAETMMNIFEAVGGDLQEIHGDARGHTVGSWKTLQLVKGASLGGSVAVIPFSGAVLLPVEFLALMRTMHRSALGVCAIHHDYVDAEQFANILAVWSGEATLTQALGAQIAAKTLAHAAYMAGGRTGFMLTTKAFASTCETFIARKLGPKVANKVAAKLAAKIGAKMGASWIPFASAFVGAGVNVWILNSLIDAADAYCRFISTCTALVPQPVDNGTLLHGS